MDNNRGRSPSRGNAQHISPQPSPNHYPGSGVQGIDPSVQQALTTGKFNTAPQLFNNPFVNQQQQQQHQQAGLQPNSSDPNFYNNTTYQPNLFSDNQFGGQSLDPNYQNNYMYQGEDMNSSFQQ